MQPRRKKKKCLGSVEICGAEIVQQPTGKTQLQMRLTHP